MSSGGENVSGCPSKYGVPARGPSDPLTRWSCLRLGCLGNNNNNVAVRLARLSFLIGRNIRRKRNWWEGAGVGHAYGRGCQVGKALPLGQRANLLSAGQKNRKGYHVGIESSGFRVISVHRVI